MKQSGVISNFVSRGFFYVLFLSEVSSANVPDAQTQEAQFIKNDLAKVLTTEADVHDIFYLSEVMSEKWMGIEFDAKEPLLKNAQMYKKIRQNSATAAEQESFLKNCSLDPNRKPFCLVLKDFEKQKVKVEKNTKPPKVLSWILDRVGYNQRHIKSWLVQGKLDKLGGLPEHDIRLGIKKISQPNDLQKIEKQVLSRSTRCKHLYLTQVLALKLEEFLPDPDVRTRMIRLYKKSAACNVGEISLKSHYRVALHELAQNASSGPRLQASSFLTKKGCTLAKTHLDKLIQHADSHDYKSRALFWKYQCSVKLSDQPALRDTKRALLTRYPFSLHSILIQKASLSPLPQLKIDSEVYFRTDRNPLLNEKIRVVEALLSLEEPILAQEVMSRIETDVFDTEPEFRLYFAAIYHRLNSHIKNFKLLSSVFKDNPKLISRTALELNYPQTLFKTPLPSLVTATVGMDNNLLLSLIRQESAFNERARSGVGALGLMQLMPATARKLASFDAESKLFDPAFNVKLGSQYFASLLARYQGDAELALAAYNAGPRRVDEWLKRYPVPDRILFLDLIPFAETREYVASIGRNYYWYGKLYNEIPSKEKEEKNLIQANRDALDRMRDRKLGEVFTLLGG